MNPIFDSGVIDSVEDWLWLTGSGKLSPEAQAAVSELRTRLWKAGYAYDRSLARAKALQDATTEQLAARKAAGAVPVDAEVVGVNWLLFYPFGEKYPGILEESFYAESCYAQLFRILERTDRAWGDLLPELKGFKPPGVTDVRNWDFEHLDHARKKVMTSNSDDGLTMFPGDQGDKRSMSRSLRENVEEFVTELQLRLDAALEEDPSEFL